ncbi:MAG: ComF family protein [Clostridia bacterium]
MSKKYVQFEIYDIIIPVPISKKRNKERGYNQSFLIAREIAKNEKVKLKNNVISKVKNNNTQSKLNKEERAENVKNVYKITNNKEIIDKNILLIDDIFTTGATLNECSKMLKQAGTKKVDVLTIAKD